jgi:hypothetical protein
MDKRDRVHVSSWVSIFVLVVFDFLWGREGGIQSLKTVLASNQCLLDVAVVQLFMLIASRADRLSYNNKSIPALSRVTVTRYQSFHAY